MEFCYLKVQDSNETKSKETKQNSVLKNFIYKFLTTILPQANPDFDDKIENVKYWLIEFNLENGIPNREIGISKEDSISMIMPWKENYGYWTDNEFKFADFKGSFDTEEISKQEFESKWNWFVDRHGEG